MDKENCKKKNEMKMKKMLSPEEDFSDVSYTYLHKYCTGCLWVYFLWSFTVVPPPNYPIDNVIDTLCQHIERKITRTTLYKSLSITLPITSFKNLNIAAPSLQSLFYLVKFALSRFLTIRALVVQFQIRHHKSHISVHLLL